MKKTIAIIASFVLAASSAFAERFLEFGIDVFADANENLMGANDVFVKDLVIDLDKIAKSLGNDGMVINATLSPSMYFNLNLGPFGAGLGAGFSGNAKLGLSKEFFELLAYGNEYNKPVEAGLNAGLELYGEVSGSAKFGIRNFSVAVTPSVFIPVAYMPNPNATLTLLADQNGEMYATANADYKIYTLVDATGIMGEGENAGFNIDSVTGAFSNEAVMGMVGTSAGFDLGGKVTVPFLFNLTLGGYAHIPLVPGHLHYSVSGNATATASVDGILDSVMAGMGGASGEGEGAGEEGDGGATGGEDKKMYDFTYTMSDIQYSKNENFSVNRPLRIGVTADWTPFGSWCVFHGSLGIGAKNPFGEDFKFGESTYTEYSFGVDASLLYVLRLSFLTQYSQEIFSHNLGFGLNLYLLEAHVNVGLSSSDFAKSFCASGASVNVGVSMGL